MWENFVIAEAEAAMFVGGLAGGLALGVIGTRVFARAAQAELARRFDELELRLSGMHDHGAALQAVAAIAADVPRLAARGVKRALDDGEPKRWWSRNRADGEQIARELAAAFKVNLEAAIDIGNAIAENKELGDPAQRREVARAVKRAGARLTTAFWERWGSAIRGSSMPASLKSKLEKFFRQVATLKRAVSDLPAEPSPSSLIQVVERVVDLLNTAKEIAEEAERLA